MGIVTAGMGFVFPNCQAGAVAPFPERAGAASAMSGFLQMSVAAAAGLGIMAIWDGSAVPMGFSVFACIAGSLAAYWWLIADRPSRGCMARNSR